jgi:alkylhydroperoxidase family enzyme
MTRVPYVRMDEIPAEYADIAARRINIYRVAAHSLEGARAFSMLGKYIRYSSKLDARLRELVVLQVGYVTRCGYEFYHHLKIGKQFGVTDDDVHAMIGETRGEETRLDVVDKAALRMARQLTHQIAVDQDTFATLSGRLPIDALIDLALTISHYNGAVRFLHCFDVDLEEEYEALVAKFPLPALSNDAGSNKN